MRIFASLLLFASTLFAQILRFSIVLIMTRRPRSIFREVGVEQRGDVAIHDISYASPQGGRVPAYLVVPKGKGPFAAVIWGHWYQQGSAFLNRKEFLDEAVALGFRRGSVLTARWANRATGVCG